MLPSCVSSASWSFHCPGGDARASNEGMWPHVIFDWTPVFYAIDNKLCCCFFSVVWLFYPYQNKQTLAPRGDRERETGSVEPQSVCSTFFHQPSTQGMGLPACLLALIFVYNSLSQRLALGMSLPMCLLAAWAASNPVQTFMKKHFMDRLSQVGLAVMLSSAQLQAFQCPSNHIWKGL